LAGVGAYALANLFIRNHVPFLITMPLVFLIGMVVSLLIGLPALRIRGLYLAVVTLGFNIAVAYWVFRSSFIGRSTAGIIVRPPKLGPWDLDSPSGRPLFAFTLILLALSLVLAGNLAKGRTGRGFFAVRENEKAAATMGVRLTRYKLLAFAVSGGLAALAGSSYAMVLGKAAYTDWDAERSLTLVAMVMIGGLGSRLGAVFGAFLVFGLPRLVHFNNGYIVPIGTGILLIVVIVRARGGVAGVLQYLRDRTVESLDDLSQHTAAAPPAAPTPGG
jgi:branched-chain amino acid transport system permease protein